ncbi:MAG: ABC transporter permease subunit [Clostridiales bacterium]|nr:ABC transporter permease subunit [Clostridiales bacterium]
MKRLIPLAAITLTLATQAVLPNSPRQPTTAAPYFTYFLIFALAVYTVFAAISLFSEKTRAYILRKYPFISGVFIFLTALNFLTSKFAVLPALYFPSLDRVFAALTEERALLLKCLSYSTRLLIVGYLCGALAGFFTGVCIGFNKTVSYWVSPIVRILGPIPSVAWIPLALIAFSSASRASSFLIGLSVWFPTTIMTSSGIINVEQAYFEAGSVFGANAFQRIFKIGVPAAMPHIFLGLFNGVCASFITLVTAEMIGAKYGLGWYINWQKDMLSYANVYAGLLVIAASFSILISLMFRARDKALSWQKGMVKW